VQQIEHRGGGNAQRPGQPDFLVFIFILLFFPALN
jgi:hypothetical protein